MPLHFALYFQALTNVFFQWYEKFTDVDEVIPVSAKYGQGVEDVKEWILSKLPLGPSYYSKVFIIFLFLLHSGECDSFVMHPFIPVPKALKDCYFMFPSRLTLFSLFS